MNRLEHFRASVISLLRMPCLQTDLVRQIWFLTCRNVLLFSATLGMKIICANSQFLNKEMFRSLSLSSPQSYIYLNGCQKSCKTEYWLDIHQPDSWPFLSLCLHRRNEQVPQSCAYSGHFTQNHLVSVFVKFYTVSERSLLSTAPSL